MKITNLEVRNFKSIKQQEIDFGDFNVLIGQNASGKSNILEILQFIRDLTNEGLENAVQLRGGTKYFRNTRIGEEENFKLTFDTNIDESRGPRTRVEGKEEDYVLHNPSEIHYEIEISFEENEFEVVQEKLDVKCLATQTEENLRPVGESFDVDYSVTRSEDQINLSINSEKLELKPFDESIPERFQDENIGRKKSFFEMSSVRFLWAPLINRQLEVDFYDVQPNEVKGGTTIKGKSTLERDASNLPLVIKSIIDSEGDKDKFSTLVRDLLPYMRDWRTETRRDKSIVLEVLEDFEGESKDYLPSSLISDGTINIISLIVILYFESNEVVLIEEPERNIHPGLIPKIVNMMEDASDQKQVVISTHNPEIIKYTDNENIKMVERDEEGFTRVLDPREDAKIAEFLKSGMKLEEIYVKNLFK